MVRTVARIEQEITALDRLVAALTQEFHDTYHQYLNNLGQAVRQQLILASFHVCTHGYPEQFLQLPFSERQDLQQKLRQLSKQAQTQLLEILQPVQSIAFLMAQDSLSDESEFADEDADEESETSTAFSADTDADINADINSKTDEADTDAADMDNRVGSDAGVSGDDFGLSQAIENSESPTQDSNLADRNSEDHNPEDRNSENRSLEVDDRPITPIDLASWQENLEESISEVLQTLSYTANRILQQAEILPPRLPEPVLEVATKADLASETTNSPPNLLSLLVETASEEDQETAMTQITAIRLRLSEIEFGDQSATIGRSKIRNLSIQLNKLGREYQKKQREKAVAQAEAAWRSSWFED